MSEDALPVFHYALTPLRPGPLGLRRTRWELYDGPRLLGAGWHQRPELAERALRAAASRRAHELIGLRPLRPWQARAEAPLRPGAAVTVDCGAARCVLAPHDAEPFRAGATAA